MARFPEEVRKVSYNEVYICWEVIMAKRLLLLILIFIVPPLIGLLVFRYLLGWSPSPGGNTLWVVPTVFGGWFGIIAVLSQVFCFNLRSLISFRRGTRKSVETPVPTPSPRNSAPVSEREKAEIVDQQLIWEANLYFASPAVLHRMLGVIYEKQTT